MTKQEVRKKLSEYPNGGNAFLILDYLLDSGKKDIKISQEDLASALNKTRPSIQNSLETLVEIGIIEIGYGKVKLLEEIV